MTLVIVVAAATAALIAAAVWFLGRDSDDAARFPDPMRDNFITACVSGGAPRSVCECSVEAYEAEFTVEEFAALEIEIVATGRTPPGFLDPAMDCLGR